MGGKLCRLEEGGLTRGLGGAAVEGLAAECAGWGRVGAKIMGDAAGRATFWAGC